MSNGGVGIRGRGSGGEGEAIFDFMYYAWILTLFHEFSYFETKMKYHENAKNQNIRNVRTQPSYTVAKFKLP